MTQPRTIQRLTGSFIRSRAGRQGVKALLLIASGTTALQATTCDVATAAAFGFLSRAYATGVTVLNTSLDVWVNESSR